MHNIIKMELVLLNGVWNFSLSESFKNWINLGCALKIGDGLPSELGIRETANVLARYASICQQVNFQKQLIFKFNKLFYLEWPCTNC